MNDRTIKLTKTTLMPVGFVILLLAGTWAVATDWQRNVENIRINTLSIARNREELTEMSATLRYLERAMARVETKLGTLPTMGGRFP